LPSRGALPIELSRLFSASHGAEPHVPPPCSPRPWPRSRPPSPSAAPQAAHKSEIDLALPDLTQVPFLGTDGHTLLLYGLGVCVLGLVFGLVIYGQLKNMPVHKAMLEISELIYATCKTYLVTQIKFIVVLELFIGAIMCRVLRLLLQHQRPVACAVILASA
jgi:K(+)-stimulated pyrophosphate-energized sodium pump